MAHHHNNSAYGRLTDRLNRFPQGAPVSDMLFGILKILFSEKEAGLVAQLPIKPFTAQAAATIWKLPLVQAQKILDELAGRAILLDMDIHGEQTYCLPPPMAGFFEFALMRVRDDIDQKTLSELYHQYINVEEDFMRDLFVQGETGLGRVFVREDALENPYRLEILDHERAAHIIDTSKEIGVSMCYCRHKKWHMGTNCDAPMDICMTFNTAAHSLIKHGHARSVSKEECNDLLHQAYEHGLVQFGENNREGVNFICNCCGCCCEALQAARKFSPMQPVATTNYLPKVSFEKCIGCGKCAKVCPILAIAVKEDKEGKRRAVINTEICLGCGVCARNCPAGAIELEKRPVQIITPVNSTHRFVLQAIEKGTLQNLIFDNQAFANHRAMAAVFGTILKLPPLKQAMASRQFKSIYLDKLLSTQKKSKSD